MSDIQKQLEMRELVDNLPLKEKLRELENWEKNMKAREKDSSLSLKNIQDEIPVRTKLKEPEITPVNGLPPAAEEDDEQTKKQKMANLEKEKGNKCVQLGEYEKAKAHYTDAIDLNPKEPIFYSNRAHCHLKLKQYKKAIEDCDRAIALDKTGIKFHYRRMQANDGLENYDQAMRDCMAAIQLNTEDKTLRVAFDRLKNLKIAKEQRLLKEPPKWKPKLKKLWSKFQPDEPEIKFQDKPPHLRSKKPLKRLVIKETFSTPEPIEKFPDHVVDKLFSNFTGESTSNTPTPSTSFSPYNNYRPLLPLFPSNEVKTSTNMPSSPDRSIDDIFGSMNVESMRGTPYKTVLTPKKEEQKYVAPLIIDDKIDAMKPTSSPESESKRIFDIPKTGVQFFSTWKDLNESERFQYLKQMEGKSVIANLGPTLDSKLLSELLSTLSRDFCSKDLAVSGIVSALMKNSGLGILSIMASSEDKENVKKLKQFMADRKEIDEEELAKITNLFSV